MEDINALYCKLQDISKTLEAFQASVLVQDQQILCGKKEALCCRERIESLSTQFADLESEHDTIFQRHDMLKTQTTMLEVDLSCKEAMLYSTPSIIRKICTDYEVFSKKKANSIVSLIKALKDNRFWIEPIAASNQECKWFRNILKETMQSRNMFRSSEEERIRKELEAEESKLARLEKRISESVRVTPTMSARPVTPPPSHDPHHETPQYATDPFSDWAYREQPPQNYEADRSLESISKREETFPRYKPCYAVCARTTHKDDDIVSDCGDNDKLERTGIVTSEAVTINTTTVTKVIRTAHSTTPTRFPSQFLQEGFQNQDAENWIEANSLQEYSQDQGVPWFRELKRRRTGTVLPLHTSHQPLLQQKYGMQNDPYPCTNPDTQELVDLYACEMTSSEDEKDNSRMAGKRSEQHFSLAECPPSSGTIQTNTKNRFRTGREHLQETRLSEID